MGGDRRLHRAARARRGDRAPTRGAARRARPADATSTAALLSARASARRSTRTWRSPAPSRRTCRTTTSTSSTATTRCSGTGCARSPTASSRPGCSTSRTTSSTSTAGRSGRRCSTRPTAGRRSAPGCGGTGARWSARRREIVEALRAWVPEPALGSGADASSAGILTRAVRDHDGQRRGVARRRRGRRATRHARRAGVRRRRPRARRASCCAPTPARGPRRRDPRLPGDRARLGAGVRQGRRGRLRRRRRDVARRDPVPRVRHPGGARDRRRARGGSAPATASGSTATPAPSSCSTRCRRGAEAMTRSTSSTSPAAPLEPIERVGGKALGLGRLLERSLEVPPGFVVTTDAYRAFVAEHGLDARDRADPRGRRSASPASATRRSRSQALFADRRARERARSTPPTQRLRATATSGAAVAVRSSATAEDGAEASYAGQQDSHLWVRGAAEVRRHIVACWASLFSAPAISYRRRDRRRRGRAGDGGRRPGDGRGARRRA